MWTHENLQHMTCIYTWSIIKLRLKNLAYKSQQTLCVFTQTPCTRRSDDTHTHTQTCRETCAARFSRTALWLVSSAIGGVTRGGGRFTKPTSTQLNLSFTTDLSSNLSLPSLIFFYSFANIQKSLSDLLRALSFLINRFTDKLPSVNF